MSVIKVLRIHEEAEPDQLYNLEDMEGAQHFFNNMFHNAEIGEIKISIEEMTPEAWAEAERIGVEMS